MSCVKASPNARPLLLGIFLAALSFSYAIATTPETASGAGHAVSARAIGSALRISNPSLSADVFDLGDACFGAQFVRYISALGGVTPYRFALTSAGTNASAITVERAGRVAGAVPGAPSPASFTATLTDATGAVRTGSFRVNAMNCSTSEFRFAQDRLPEAQVGQDYITRIETINQDNTTVFSVVNGSVQFNGGQSGMEFEGFTLFQDGTLAGRPLRSGTLTFTARATKGGQTARNRANTVNDQAFTISITPLTQIQSVLAVTASQLKGNTTLPTSALNLSALINTNGDKNADFANKRFVLRIGGLSFGTTLDATGQARFGNLIVKLSAPEGSLKVQLRNADFTSVISDSTIIDRVPTTLVVQIEIGDTYIGTEAVNYSTRDRIGRFNMSYKLGKDRQLGGLFQITSVDGADSGGGTAFKVKFLVSHVKGRSDIEFGVAQTARVLIGQSFDQSVFLKKGRGKFGPPGVSSLKIDGKKKTGQLITYSLPQSLTGIAPVSAGVTTPQTFLMGMDISTTTTNISGDSSRIIFPVLFR